jgi:3-mercaptopropionate dioxygenase
VEHQSEAVTKSRAFVMDFDMSLANLKSNLELWIGKALAAPDPLTGLSLLCRELEVAISRGGIALPDRLCAVLRDHYARRLVYEDPTTGISVLAMVWAPGQSTPLHDHSGQWVVEAVLAGEIETVPFELIGHKGGEYHFHSRPTERVPMGSTSYLLPPFEHHVTRNVSRQVAITLNIYGGELPACNIFLPTGFGTYIRQRRTLSYSV